MSRLLTERYADRIVRVLVPPAYDELRRDPYPLVLLHDGQNLFGNSTAPGGGSWHVDRTIEQLIAEERIPPVVVAGIDHLDEGRIDEFGPTAAGTLGGGGAPGYARLVLAEIVPRLAGDYHVRADPGSITLGGSSMGGLVTLWMAILFPGFFGGLIVMSPSLWWDRRVVLRHLRKHELHPLPRTWIDAGRKEGATVTRDARELYKLLRRSNRHPIRYVEDPRGDHSEDSWGRRLPDALEWVYRR